MSISAATAQPISSTGTTAANPLSTLSSNFGDFLSLLMTQLQNQDPTTPMDANTFTTELVQFSSVEQQIDTNSSLTTLIQLTQAGSLIQSAAMVGKAVAVQSNQLVVQNGQAGLQFTSPAAEPVSIAITNAAGGPVFSTTVSAASGANSWSWNGQNSSGNTVPDGLYGVTVQGATAGGTAGAVPFDVTGTATGVTSVAGTLNLQVGALSVPFSSVQAVGN